VFCEKESKKKEEPEYFTSFVRGGGIKRRDEGKGRRRLIVPGKEGGGRCLRIRGKKGF